ncbi:hypothetical protein MRB53_030629 [Persea americana]|uniref:Uncharacterized protein n=1 Tax=Persea americana TaxID=3435 RepID=A0ACC2KLT2_PERAE|nr:hypothetical protein MRB53_030629 [Persea americana]
MCKFMEHGRLNFMILLSFNRYADNYCFIVWGLDKRNLNQRIRADLCDQRGPTPDQIDRMKKRSCSSSHWELITIVPPEKATRTLT